MIQGQTPMDIPTYNEKVRQVFKVIHFLLLFGKGGCSNVKPY